VKCIARRLGFSIYGIFICIQDMAITQIVEFSFVAQSSIILLGKTLMTFV
jgi:hypothetical protein